MSQKPSLTRQKQRRGKSSESRPVLSSTSSAPRVAVFREKLGNGGYRRADIVIPKNVSKRVKDVAKLESTSYAEALASLAQLGLAVYDARQQYASSNVDVLSNESRPLEAPGAAPAGQQNVVAQNASLPMHVAGFLRSYSEPLVCAAASTSFACSSHTEAAETASVNAVAVEVPSALAQAALSPIESFFRKNRKE